MAISYRIYKDDSLIGETTQKKYVIKKLIPYCKYTFSVAAFNDMREGDRVAIPVTTRQLNFIIPNATLPIGKFIDFYYQEYSLGLVPLGTEPTGMFGGGNAKKIYAKIIDHENGNSIFVPLKTITGFDDLSILQKQPDGTFASFSDYRAIYYVP